MIVVDANFLVLMLDPDAMPHCDRGAERIEEFIRQRTRIGDTVMIPAPALAELVAGRLDRVEEIMERLSRNRVFVIQPFDEVIAIETGHLIAAALARRPASAAPEPGWKVAMKYDAMIAATAKVRGATAVCTDDGGFGPYLVGTGIEIIKLSELPLPPEPDQGDLGF